MSSFGYSRIGFPRAGPAITALLVVNTVVFLLNLVLGGALSGWFAVSWPLLWEGYGLGLLRLLSYQFTHSYYDPWHFLLNMLFLWMFGSMAEGAIGYRGIFKLYLSGGVVAAFVHMLIYWLALHRHVPVIGASGSCYALLLFAVCIAPRLEILLLFLPVQLLFVGVLLVGLALYSLLVELREGVSSGVSDCAHLGGAAWGWLAFRRRWFRDYGGELNLFGALLARLRRWRARQQHEARQQQEQQLDEILAKVKDHGLQSLSREERRFLDRLSQKGRKS